MLTLILPVFPERVRDGKEKVGFEQPIIPKLKRIKAMSRIKERLEMRLNPILSSRMIHIGFSFDKAINVPR